MGIGNVVGLSEFRTISSMLDNVGAGSAQVGSFAIKTGRLPLIAQGVC